MTVLPKRNSPGWEKLCDGCAKCCIYPNTNVACQYLDIDKRRCLAYEFRDQVPHCQDLSELSDRGIKELMPGTCAYSRAIDGKKPLPTPTAPMQVISARLIPLNQKVVEFLNEEYTHAED